MCKGGDCGMMKKYKSKGGGYGMMKKYKAKGGGYGINNKCACGEFLKLLRFNFF